MIGCSSNFRIATFLLSFLLNGSLYASQDAGFFCKGKILAHNTQSGEWILIT